MLCHDVNLYRLISCIFKAHCKFLLATLYMISEDETVTTNLFELSDHAPENIKKHMLLKRRL